MARLMSEAEQRRRQKAQSKIGRTTSTLGLAGVGLAGTGALVAHKPGLLKNVPKLKNADPEKLKNAAFHTGIISGGIGGVGGFNQASIYSAESRRRKTPTTVKKGLDMDMGHFGEVGLPLSHEEIEKVWDPVGTDYDPEASRKKRGEAYAGAATAGAVGGAVGTGIEGGKYLHQGKKAGKLAATLKAPKASSKFRALKAAQKTTGKRAVVGAGITAAAAGGAAALHRGNKSKSWEPYAKRDATSAFGIDHMNGQHRETGN